MSAIMPVVLAVASSYEEKVCSRKMMRCVLLCAGSIRAFGEKVNESGSTEDDAEPECRDLIVSSEDQGEYAGLNCFANAQEHKRKSGSAVVCGQKLELDVKGEFKATTLAHAKAVGEFKV